MNTYWISLPCDLLSSLASFQCSLLHHLHLSSDLGLSKYVNQHSHLNLSRNVRLSVLYDLDFNTTCHGQLEPILQPYFYAICLTSAHRQFCPKTKPQITGIKSTIGLFQERHQERSDTLPYFEG